MNAAHLHLMVNHFPLFASLFGGLIAAVGVYRERTTLIRTGLVLTVVAALGAFVAVETGEGAEEVVEEVTGVSRATIHDHEEAAEAAMWALAAAALLSLAALVVPGRRDRAKYFTTLAALGATFVAFALVARAANLGGMIRHPEITSATSVEATGLREA